MKHGEQKKETVVGEESGSSGNGTFEMQKKLNTWEEISLRRFKMTDIWWSCHEIPVHKHYTLLGLSGSLSLLTRSGFLRESILVFELFRHIGAIKCTSLPPYLAKPLVSDWRHVQSLWTTPTSSLRPERERGCYDCQHIIILCLE